MTTSLNALTLRINASTEGVSAAVKAVRGDVNRINSILRQTATASERTQQAQESLARVFRTGAISQQEYERALTAISRRFGETSGRVDTAASAFRNISGLVAQTRPPMEALKQQFRDLFTAMNAGKITQDEYARALASVKQKAKQLRDEETGSAAARRAAEEQQKRVNATLQRAIPPIDRLQREIRELQSEYYQGNIASREYQRALAMLSAEQRKQAEAARNATNSNKQSSISLRSLSVAGVAAAAAYKAIAAAGRGLRTVFGTALNLETTAVQFEVLTGSAQEAGRIINELRRMDRENPVLGLPELQRATQTMMQFGVSSQDVTGVLGQLSAISGGNAERLQSLSLAFAQTAANGRLMGQEVLQFVNAGFNPLQAISEKTGKSVTELRKEMEAGKITVADVRSAFDFATGSGGRFFGMLEQLSGTTSGAIARLQNTLLVTTTTVVQKFMPAVGAAANAIAATIDSVNNWAGSLSRGQRNMLLFVASIGPAVFIAGKLIAAIRGIVEVVKNWNKAQAVLLALSGPKGWAQIAIGLTLAAGAVYALDQMLETNNQTADAAIDKNEQLASSIDLVTQATRGQIQQNELRRKSDEADQKRDAYEPTLDALRQQIALTKEHLRTRAMSREELEREQAVAAGASKLQLYNLGILQQERAALDQRKKQEAERLALLQKQKEALTQRQQSLADDAKRIADSLKSPFQQLVDELQRLNEMRMQGLLTQQQFAQASQQAASGFSGGQAIKVELPPSITRGSREEYQMIAEAQNQAAARQMNADRQRLVLLTAQKVAAEKAATAVEQSNRHLEQIERGINDLSFGESV